VTPIDDNWAVDVAVTFRTLLCAIADNVRIHPSPTANIIDSFGEMEVGSCALIFCRFYFFYFFFAVQPTQSSAS
jgi:hypothetical protein